MLISMRKATIVIVAILLLPIAGPSQAAVKAGGLCKKVNQTKTVAGMDLTCKKSGKKLVWRVVKSSPGAPPTIPTNPDPKPSVPTFRTGCEKDPLVPKEWEEFQNNLNQNDCAPPYRYVVATLPSESPIAIQSPRTELIPVNQCKLQRDWGWNLNLSQGNKLNPKIVVQIVPFASNDFPATTNPSVDWKPYLNFIVDSLTKMTDVESNYQFRIPNKYFKINKNLADYGLSGAISHGDSKANPARFQLARDVVAVADSEINFSGAKYVFFFSPTNVPRNILANHIGYGQRLVTNEGTFQNSIYISSYIDDFKSPYWIPQEPFSFIHEMMHIFNTAQDYYGDADKGGSEQGMGNWGNMSRARTDHLAWDKWNSQMIGDDQIRCADKTKSTVHWLKPSTISGRYEKLLMIPINRFEAIVVESMRASGFNYKLPASLHGAIVYHLNVAEIDDIQKHGDGAYILCPTNRYCSKAPDPNYAGFRAATASLKPGDYVDVFGMRIKVVEAGDFGDVISVEPITK